MFKAWFKKYYTPTVRDTVVGTVIGGLILALIIYLISFVPQWINSIFNFPYNKYSDAVYQFLNEPHSMDITWTWSKIFLTICWGFATFFLVYRSLKLGNHNVLVVIVTYLASIANKMLTAFLNLSQDEHKKTQQNKTSPSLSHSKPEVSTEIVNKPDIAIHAKDYVRLEKGEYQKESRWRDEYEGLKNDYREWSAFLKAIKLLDNKISFRYAINYDDVRPLLNRDLLMSVTGDDDKFILTFKGEFFEKMAKAELLA